MYAREDELRLIRKYEVFSSLSEISIATYKREYLTYEEAKMEASHLAKKYDIKKWADWRSFSKSPKRPSNLPSNPQRTYKKDFVSLKDFLGF
jgi:hypothetical protein